MRGDVSVGEPCVLPSKQVQKKKWDQNHKADPEKQPALGESDLKPPEGETPNICFRGETRESGLV